MLKKLVVIILLIAVTGCQSSKQAWMKRADMPTARTCRAVTVDGKIYAFGINSQSHISVEEYDPKADKWIAKRNMSKMTNNGEFALAPLDGKIYVAGGYNENPLDLAEVYHPLEDTWKEIKNMPVPVDCASAGSANGKLYVMGGVDSNSTVTGVVQEYNPMENIWTLKESMLTPRSEFGIAEVEGKLYTLGGNWGTGLEVEEYDPVKNEWGRKADMFSKCVAFQASAANGKIYTVFRGDVQEYNPIDNKWTLKNKSPEEKVWLNGATSVENRIYILGGLEGEMKEFPKGELRKTVWKFDPSVENVN